MLVTPKTKFPKTTDMNNKFNPSNLLMIFAIVISVAMLNSCQEETVTLVKNFSTSLIFI